MCISETILLTTSIEIIFNGIRRENTMWWDGDCFIND